MSLGKATRKRAPYLIDMTCRAAASGAPSRGGGRIACVFLLATTCLAAEPPGAEYYPMKPGSEWVYDYRNEMIANYPGLSYSNVTVGIMRVRVVGKETTNGVEYVVTETTYENIFNVLPQRGLLRLAEDGIHQAGEIHDQFSETILMAIPPDVGTSWEYYDGVAGRKRVAGLETVEAAGKNYERCLKIVRDFKDPEKQKTITSEEYYAPGVGQVLFKFRQKGELDSSETETRLISFTVP